MLTITTWMWGDKYGLDDVAKLSAGFKRHLKRPHRFICFSDRTFTMIGVEVAPIEDIALTLVQGCFARLRMFDPVWQARYFDGPFVCSDLDTIITGGLDPVFNRIEPFVILQGANSVNPCPYCGALMMVQPGAVPQLWADFSLDAVTDIPRMDFPDDQGWAWVKAPLAAGWRAGTGGVYAFQKPGWPPGELLPGDARLVTFNGWRSPAAFQRLGWVQEHWRK